MNVTNAVLRRVSTRAFLDTPVPKASMRRIFETAQRAPSNCNVQPWEVYVVSGAAKNQLKERIVEVVMSGRPPNPDFNWEVKYEGRHKDRQYASAYSLYTSMGIERSDKTGRMMAMLRNWNFFDAPHSLFLTMEKYLDTMGAVDLGIYIQTLCLLMEEEGISSCIQGALGQFPDPIREYLKLPETHGILFGMSFGYADSEAPVNTTRTDRVSLDDAVTFIS